MTKKRLLLAGDFVVQTGFGRVNHAILERFNPEVWDIGVMAVNYYGDHTPHQTRFRLWPASGQGADLMGIGRLVNITEAFQPDVTILHNDAWIVGQYLDALRDASLLSRQPLIGICPPDAPNQPSGRRLCDLDLLVCPTHFGIQQLQLGGFSGAADQIPYGVDTSLYQPRDQYESRVALGFANIPQFKDDSEKLRRAFILGRADRNSPRKRYDLTFQAFAAFLDLVKLNDPNVWLHCHCAVRDVGFDLPQLAEYYGIANHVIFTSEELNPAALPPEDMLVAVYNSWSWHVSTTLGEGHGLVAHESAACGVPQILPRSSAYAEWMRAGALFVEPRTKVVASGGINSEGGEVDPTELAALLSNVRVLGSAYREEWSRKANNVATGAMYSWDTIAGRIEAHCDRLLMERSAHVSA